MIETRPAAGARVLSRHGLSPGRIRVQFGGAILLAGVLPGMIRAVAIGDYTVPDAILLTLIAATVAALVSCGFFRNLGTYPGLESSAYVIPCVVPTYGIAAAVLLFARLDYSRLILAASFAICTFWLYALFFLQQRRRQLLIAVVPFGDVTRIEKISGVAWRRLKGPSLRGAHPDAIAADFNADIPDDWDRFIADTVLTGLPVYDIRQLRESLTGKVEIDRPSENSFGALAPLASYLRIRSIAERLVAAVALITLAPLLVAVAIAIRADSRGPALFRQPRVGYRGRLFSVAKFRTMRADDNSTDDALEQAKTREGDVRITRLGRFLRRTRIDEIPQLINVLMGEMSLIGPRPEALVLSQWYETEIPFYRYRHIVPPGITGWAQVSQGHVAEVDDVRTKLHYDFYYIKHFSVWLDVIIVLRTFKTMFSGSGAK